MIDLLIIFEIILFVILIIAISIFTYKYIQTEKEKHLNITKILSNILFVSLIGFIIQLVQLKQNEYKNRAELIQIFYQTLLTNNKDKIKKSLILINAIDPYLYNKINAIQNINPKSINEIVNKITLGEKFIEFVPISIKKIDKNNSKIVNLFESLIKKN